MGRGRLLFPCGVSERFLAVNRICLGLEVVNDVTNVFCEKWPRVQQKDFVRHYDNDAVVSLKATRIVIVLQEEILT